MQNPPPQPQHWEYTASALATASATIVAIVTSTRGRMAQLPLIVDFLENPPALLLLVTDVPKYVWWAITVAVAALLYWAGLKLSKRWGTPALLIAPAVMVVAQFVVPWLLFAPIRAALPPASF